MANTTIRLKDSGLDEVGGTAVYNQVNYGNWLPLDGFTLRGEFTVQKTEFASTRTDPTNESLLTFKANEIASVLPPRITIQGLVDATDVLTISDIVDMGRSKGIKRLTGGLGLIEATYDGADTYAYWNVLITNITFSEVVRNGTSYINFTIQAEQVN